MPFANYCGGIARLTKKLGESLLVSVEFITVNKKPFAWEYLPVWIAARMGPQIEFVT